MERTGRRLTTRETVLLLVAAAGGEVEGRTVMQKLAYFSGLELGAAFGHRAHFYGPYSSRVEDALTQAAIAGDLRESIDRLPDWHGGPDVVKYSYELTDSGTERVENLKHAHPREWGRISEAVGAIREAVPDFNQRTLSSAAKTYLILSEREDPTSEADVPKLASKLGWQLSPPQVRETIKILENLGLVETEA